MASAPRIELSGISVDFRTKEGNLPVLRDLDLVAGDGEFVSLIGPSGCGKSTLLNVIAGLEEPAEGTIRFDGALATDRIGTVAYMPQRDLLMPWRTVLDNTILGLEIQGVPREEARRRSLELFDLFGLRGFERAYPAVLSGGMRQRAAFLRTVLTGKDVLLLDEPFGALDALTRSNLQDWLLHLWGSLRKTILLVTHDVDESVLLSDRVYVLTARPGTVKLVAEVDLPRPREYAMVTSDRFARVKERLLAAIRDEALAAELDEAGMLPGAPRPGAAVSTSDGRAVKR